MLLVGETVLRGLEGYGASNHIHTTRILSMSEDLPNLVGVAGNQTVRAGKFIRELNLPADIIATSDDRGTSKPDPLGILEKLIDVSGHDRDENLYVGDRLANDIAPAAKAGLQTVLTRRGRTQ